MYALPLPSARAVKVVPMPLYCSTQRDRACTAELARSTARRMDAPSIHLHMRISPEKTRTAMALAISPALWPPMPSAIAQKRSPSRGR